MEARKWRKVGTAKWVPASVDAGVAGSWRTLWRAVPTAPLARRPSLGDHTVAVRRAAVAGESPHLKN